MSFKRLVFVFTFFCLVLSGCATTASNKNKFSEFKNINWSEIDRAGAEKILGPPDTVGVVHKTQKEALIYLAKEYKAAQLIVAYDKQTNKILSVHWFANKPSDKITLNQTLSRFSGIKVQENPAIKEGAWGETVEVYSSSDSPLQVVIDSKTHKLSSLSWQFEVDDNMEQRRPTSH